MSTTYGYVNLSPRARALLRNAGGTVVVSTTKLQDGTGLTMHLRSEPRRSRCGKVRNGTVMHVRHAERIAVSCERCWA